MQPTSHDRLGILGCDPSHLRAKKPITNDQMNEVYNSNCVFFSTVIPVTFIYVFSISLYLRPKGVIIYLGHI
jgi:hypothetical protein